MKRDLEELKREWEEGIRWGDKGKEGIRWVGKEKEGGIREKVVKELQGLIDLTYGEDCMLGRQVSGLEKKMMNEKTLPQKEMIKRSWSKAKSADTRFWRLAKERFGLEKDKKGKFGKRTTDRQ